MTRAWLLALPVALSASSGSASCGEATLPPGRPRALSAATGGA